MFQRFFSFRIPLYVFFIAVTIISGMFYFYEVKGKQTAVRPFTGAPESTLSCKMKMIRKNGMDLIKPLLLSDIENEDDQFKPIKSSINLYIQGQKAAGVLTSASVYLRKIDNGSWMSINAGEQYSPGSLMKVPTMITYLKDAEQRPALLKKEILFKKHFGGIPTQTITGAGLTEGKTYTVGELLKYMIEYSDNDATALLNQNINFPVMQQLFADLQLAVPDKNQQDYFINASDYARFFRVLYNSSYLKPEMSQFALQLLSKSAFKEGLVKEINPDIVVAHKFGERNNNGEQQLHEFGIIYLHNNPYLLGVMTKGRDHTLLPQCISSISKIVFDAMTVSQSL